MSMIFIKNQKIKYSSCLTKISELKTLDFYQPSKWTDYDNFVHLHELEYKIYWGEKGIDPLYEKYQRHIIESWKISLRMIFKYYYGIFKYVFEKWLSLHSPNPEEWAEARINFDEFIPNFYSEYQSYEDLSPEEELQGLIELIRMPRYGVVRIAEEIPEHLDELPEEDRDLIYELLTYNILNMGYFDLVSSYEEEIYEIINVEYSEKFTEFGLLDEEIGKEQSEVLVDFLSAIDIDEEWLQKRLISKLGMKGLFESEIPDTASLLNLIRTNFFRISTISNMIKAVYKTKVHKIYLESFDEVELNESYERVKIAYDMLMAVSPEHGNVSDLASAFSICLNTMHKSGYMTEWFPNNQERPNRMNDLPYTFSWREFAKNNGYTGKDRDVESKFIAKQIVNLNKEDLENLSNLDTRQWNRDLKSDYFIINQGSDVQKFHQPSLSRFHLKWFK